MVFSSFLIKKICFLNFLTSYSDSNHRHYHIKLYVTLTVFFSAHFQCIINIIYNYNMYSRSSNLLVALGIPHMCSLTIFSISLSYVPKLWPSTCWHQQANTQCSLTFLTRTHAVIFLHAPVYNYDLSKKVLFRPLTWTYISALVLQFLHQYNYEL